MGLAKELRQKGLNGLADLVEAVERVGARRVVITSEDLAAIEQQDRELWTRVKEWLETQGVVLGAPQPDALQGGTTSLGPSSERRGDPIRYDAGSPSCQEGVTEGFIRQNAPLSASDPDAPGARRVRRRRQASRWRRWQKQWQKGRKQWQRIILMGVLFLVAWMLAIWVVAKLIGSSEMEPVAQPAEGTIPKYYRESNLRESLVLRYPYRRGRNLPLPGGD